MKGGKPPTAAGSARGIVNPSVARLECRAKPIVVASFPRSGTHLTIDGLRHFFVETRRRQRFNQSVHDLYLNLDRLDPVHPFAIAPEAVRRMLAESEKRVIIKTHCSTELEQAGEGNAELAAAVIAAADVVYVVRDVRPVMTSYMALRPLKFADSPTEIGVFLRTEMDGGGIPIVNWVRHVSGWMARPGVRVVKFEEMMRDYAGTIVRLGESLGLTRRAGRGGRIRLYGKPRSVFENKTRRVLGMQNCSSIDNLRMHKDTPNWRMVMSEEDLALIRTETEELMGRLGYRW